MNVENDVNIAAELTDDLPLLISRTYDCISAAA
jgi:hypothetical protein